MKDHYMVCLIFLWFSSNYGIYEGNLVGISGQIRLCKIVWLVNLVKSQKFKVAKKGNFIWAIVFQDPGELESHWFMLALSCPRMYEVPGLVKNGL